METGDLEWGVLTQGRVKMGCPSPRGCTGCPSLKSMRRVVFTHQRANMGCQSPPTCGEEGLKGWGRGDNGRQVTYKGTKQIRKHIKDNRHLVSQCHKRELQILK